MHSAIDVVGVGAALVDVLANVDEAHLDAQSLVKGTMALIDADDAERIYAALPPSVEMSGGSVANTTAGVCSLGGTAGFVGKVTDDQLGGVFRHDLRAQGVAFATAPLPPDGVATGRCLSLVTSDAERTMCTFLGASVAVEASDVVVAGARFVFLEGYLWDWPDAPAVVAAALAGGAEGVALSLSDPFCVERHRDSYRELLPSLEVLIGNEDEVLMLTGAATVEAALEMLPVPTVAITRGAKGALVRGGGEVADVPAFPVEKLVDTTGAGDLFAAGFLFGLARGFDIERCGRLAALCAGEIISHIGARPLVPLSGLAAEHGLL